MRGSPEQRPLVILGGGLSGSLLVEAMHRRGVRRPVVLMDRSDRGVRGRRWAGFATERDSADRRALRRVRVVTGRGSREQQLRDVRYVVLDADALSQELDEALDRLGGLRTLAEVTRTETGLDVAVVDTSAGPVTGSWVFDSTEREPAAWCGTSAVAWMHFCGLRVAAEAGTFDPATVTLMDLTVPSRGQLRFGYVLPESTSEALIELTAVTGCPEPPALDNDLHAYADRVCSAPWTVRAGESGTSRLCAARPRRRHGRVLDIGARGGLLRASTGYGLPHMARDADAIAVRLARGREPRGRRRRWRYAAMDDVMLRLILTDPLTATAAFEAMLEKNPIDRVARFMTEDSTVLDDLRLASTLPVLPLLRAAFRAPRLRRQGAGERSGEGSPSAHRAAEGTPRATTRSRTRSGSARSAP